jgi:glycosyltransferase involved in cell wall biosynthesis
MPIKAAILYNKFFDHEGKELVIGGVETYLLNLARLCQEIGMSATIWQFSNQPFEKKSEKLKIRGVPVFHLPFKQRNRALFIAVQKELDADRDILIFGADHVSVPTKNPRHISIQHGVSWDLPVKYTTERKIVKYEWAAKLKKWRSIQAGKRHFENCPNTVCVDYNFLNWYRTTVTREPEHQRIWVIPNFSTIAPAEEVAQRNYENNTIRILFARRFVEYRGTRIFAEAAKELLKKYNQISFTVAGEGPDENWLRKMLASDDRVRFSKYEPDKTLSVHLKHDIAVVPSLASEGTSLSVAEAMATGCPVVATAVGGVTSMIINWYNGILVMPNESSLVKGIESLIIHDELRQRIGIKGYETAKAAFSLDKWNAAWKNVLTEVSNAK